MAAPRQPRRGPAPFASFDHDNSDEVRDISSPETKQAFQLPEIREDLGGASTSEAGSEAAGAAGGSGLAPPGRPRSQSTPGGATPRIDISRASSSSHHDSRESSPEMALFSGDDTRGKLDVAFREDGAMDLRSSTEELAFLEGTPAAPPAPPPPAPRRHSRKDSQGSEAALLGVSGRTSRLSSVGSACSAVSATSGIGRISRLSVVSGMSRSPSPHKMLLETSFCGPRPIETDPDACAAAVEERLLEIARRSSADRPADLSAIRQIHAEVTVEPAPRPSIASVTPSAPITAPDPASEAIHTVSAPQKAQVQKKTAEPSVAACATPPPIDEDKRLKENKNRSRVEERRGRPRVRREPSEPEVYKSVNKNKDVIRIKLKPDAESEEIEDQEISRVTSAIVAEAAKKPVSLELERTSPCPIRRSPSPAAPVSRKSSFCSLFKSKETIASPDSPSGVLRRKKSLTDGRSRSKSRDRSATPTSSSKLRGSVLSLFRTPRRSVTSPAPSSRAASPGPSGPPVQRPATASERLIYYTEARDGVIHIPLRTPPEERNTSRPASAPVPDRAPLPTTTPSALPPARRTVLPDGSIIIPLHSPTEKVPQSPEQRELITCTVVASIEAPPANAVSPPAVEELVTSSECGSNQSHPSCEPTPSRDTITPPQEPERTPEPADREKERRKKRLVFTTNVGSKEQVFSTQFSITKTPSIASEISQSFPSLPGEECRPPPLRDTRITSDETVVDVEEIGEEIRDEVEYGRDSSESDGSTAPQILNASVTARGNEVEARGLVVQESFEEELPYVPTTLPQERSLALPMVPVRERVATTVSVAGVRRPRGTRRAPAPCPPPPATPPAAPAPAADKLRIKIPRRPRAASASAPAQSQRARTASCTEGSDLPSKCEWIDFEEVPERRKQPKRIQTLPVAAQDDRQTVVFNYVEPDQCRCECHAHAQDDEQPLLQGTQPARDSLSSLEGGEEAGAHARPFTADLDLQHEPHIVTDHGTLKRQ